jgi:hypothetical protein
LKHYVLRAVNGNYANDQVTMMAITTHHSPSLRADIAVVGVEFDARSARRRSMVTVWCRPRARQARQGLAKMTMAATGETPA